MLKPRDRGLCEACCSAARICSPKSKTQDTVVSGHWRRAAKAKGTSGDELGVCKAEDWPDGVQQASAIREVSRAADDTVGTRWDKIKHYLVP